MNKFLLLSFFWMFFVLLLVSFRLLIPLMISGMSPNHWSVTDQWSRLSNVRYIAGFSVFVVTDSHTPKKNPEKLTVRGGQGGKRKRRGANDKWTPPHYHFTLDAFWVGNSCNLSKQVPFDSSLSLLGTFWQQLVDIDMIWWQVLVLGFGIGLGIIWRLAYCTPSKMSVR